MNWDRIKGNWKQFQGEAKRRWGMLTDDDFDVMEGNKDKFLGRLQERYGYTKEEAERELRDFDYDTVEFTKREKMNR